MGSSPLGPLAAYQGRCSRSDLPRRIRSQRRSRVRPAARWRWKLIGGSLGVSRSCALCAHPTRKIGRAPFATSGRHAGPSGAALPFPSCRWRRRLAVRSRSRRRASAHSSGAAGLWPHPFRSSQTSSSLPPMRRNQLRQSARGPTSQGTPRKSCCPCQSTRQISFLARVPVQRRAAARCACARTRVCACLRSRSLAPQAWERGTGGARLVCDGLDAARELGRIGQDVPPLVAPLHPAVIEVDVHIARLSQPIGGHCVGDLEHEALADVAAEGVPRVPPHRWSPTNTVV
mmetsp:Transcript_17/g.86  ORF Transcript_17/g.86 Transcript_17/m.86 type:complete len:288 (+) Transcript_17:1289-2152(+)